MNQGDIKLMHDRLVQVEGYPHSQDIVDQACAMLLALAGEVRRLNAALTWEQNRSERIGTHGHGCHLWGPAHYECLLRELERQFLKDEAAK